MLISKQIQLELDKANQIHFPEKFIHIKNQMEASLIFQESDSEEKVNFVTYSDNLKDEKYVSQFLDGLNAEEDLSDHGHQPQKVKQMVDFEEFLLSFDGECPKSKGNNKKNGKATFSFHNFQKHIVTTIKYNITLEKLNIPEGLRDCVQKIWEAFVNSKKLNKTLISLLFVDLHQENPFKVAEYGFSSILEQFSREITSSSQIILSQHLKRELSALQLEKLLSHRRMKNKKDFILYFREFLKQLQNGDLNKRMIKCTKLMKKLKQKKKFQSL